MLEIVLEVVLLRYFWPSGADSACDSVAFVLFLLLFAVYWVSWPVNFGSFLSSLRVIDLAVLTIPGLSLKVHSHIHRHTRRCSCMCNIATSMHLLSL